MNVTKRMLQTSPEEVDLLYKVVILVQYRILLGYFLYHYINAKSFSR